MTATGLATKLGFKVCARDDAQVFVSPGLDWVITLRGRATAFGPIDSKPFEERGFPTAEGAEEYVKGLLQSITNVREKC